MSLEQAFDLIGINRRRLAGTAGANVNRRFAIVQGKCFRKVFDRADGPENHSIRLIDRVSGLDQGLGFRQVKVAGDHGAAWFLQKKIKPL